MLDKKDLIILSMIQKDARISNVAIARKLKMAPSAVLERLRRLKKNGVIKDYVALLDPQVLGMGMLAFVFVKTNEKREKWDVAETVSRIPEVLEVHDIAGEDCYLLKLRTKDTASLFELLRDVLGKIPAIASMRTTIVLRTKKESPIIPLTEASAKRSD